MVSAVPAGGEVPINFRAVVLNLAKLIRAGSPCLATHPPPLFGPFVRR